MNLQELLKAEERIREQTKATYVDPDNGAEPITDGLFSPTDYWNSSPRIVWVLKEPYCDGDTPTGGGWTLNDGNNWDEQARWRSFQPICYVNYGIWNKDERDWNKMPWLRHSEQMRMGLRKIGIINISKLPGCKYSPWERIVSAYKKYSKFILSQIESYTPNLIFACDPHVNLMLEGFGFNESQWKEFNTASAIQISPEQRLIWVYHPNARKNRRDYVNDAIRAATTDLPIAEKSPRS